ncbi:hypothetical protein [Virgibacillus alimentarius]|uniref:Uncharacterized protein n=1 Tax=Virgibacillus alimentarius TaxID=698769 RepID=A0ABS4SBB1_9BACI|nr:hypothetical protein [Virgibacillus alimentarius]MBP2258780.1 hypothetical protein [Virgibacillus alimentarius]
MKGESFEHFFERNRKRIHYHIHDLGIRDLHNEYYTEGVYALWKWWKMDQQSRDPVAIDIDTMIRVLLMEMVERKYL